MPLSRKRLFWMLVASAALACQPDKKKGGPEETAAEVVANGPQALIYPPLDHHQPAPALWADRAAAVVAILPQSSLDADKIKARPLAEVFCEGEPFADKEAAGLTGTGKKTLPHAFTGFLVTDQDVVTTAHGLCTSVPDCEKNCAADFSVVFGYLEGDGSTITRFDVSSIVGMGAIESTADDWIILRLARKVPPELAEPLVVANADEPTSGTFVSIAYPWGTSQTFIDNAHYLANYDGCFQHTLDSMPGFSGSPLFGDDFPEQVRGMNVSGGGTYACREEDCVRAMACDADDEGCCCDDLDSTSIPSRAFFDAVANLVAGGNPPVSVEPQHDARCFGPFVPQSKGKHRARRSHWTSLSKQAQPVTCDNLSPNGCKSPTEMCPKEEEAGPPR